MGIIKKNYVIIVILLLSSMLAIEVSTAIQESQTVDEGVHLASGYTYLMKRDFRLNREHPPLLKEWSALPLFLLQNKLESPFDSPYWSNADQWNFAKEFLYENTVSADTLFLLGRMPIILISILLGFFIFKWSRELFGTLAGLLSLLFYSFSPNIIAHARYITTDLGMTAFFFITIYYFYKYLKEHSRKNLYLTGLFFGLALASKFSALFLIPLLVLLYLIFALVQSNKAVFMKSVKRFFRIFTIIFTLGIFIVLASFQFKFIKPIDDVGVQQMYAKQDLIINSNSLNEQDNIVQKIISITNTQNKPGKIIRNIADNVPLPAFTYLSGFFQLVGHNYTGHTSYLLGNYSEFGWWYYFPLAFLVKTPITTLLLSFALFTILFTWIVKKQKKLKSFTKIIKEIPYWAIFLAIPPLTYFLFSLTSNLNLGLRHILVVYPFIFVLFGLIVKKIIIKRKLAFTILFTALLIFYIVSSLSMYPHYLAYFNEIVGGPENGSKILSDSNIDWGQDAKNLKKYMGNNNISHICLSYFGQAKLEYYDIDFRYLPDNENFTDTAAVDCVVAISITSLFSKKGEYSWLRNYTPDEKIGYSIYIYDFRKNK